MKMNLPIKLKLQVLQADSKSIASLVQRINAAKKELGM